jgi:hypothetical protein
MSVLRESSVRDYWSSHPITRTPHAASVGMSRDKFLALLTMLHLNNNDAKAAKGQQGYDPLFKIRPITDTSQNFRASTHQKDSALSTRQYALFESVYSFLCISKKNPTNMV